MSPNEKNYDLVYEDILRKLLIDVKNFLEESQGSLSQLQIRFEIAWVDLKILVEKSISVCDPEAHLIKSPSNGMLPVLLLTL
jgi:hypothetical protein